MTVPEGIVWAIFLLPVASLVIITLVTKPYPRLSGYITSVRSARLDLRALDARCGDPQRWAALPFGTYHWLRFRTITRCCTHRRPEPDITLGLRIDGLSAIMLVVVTSVSLLVQIYSTGYMEGDGGYARYFAYCRSLPRRCSGWCSSTTSPHLHLLGVGRARLLPAHRLLVPQAQRPPTPRRRHSCHSLRRLGSSSAILLIWT